MERTNIAISKDASKLVDCIKQMTGYSKTFIIERAIRESYEKIVKQNTRQT